MSVLQLVGQTIQGRYRIDDLVGQGGMATVFKAWDLERNAYVAVKLLREDLAQDLVFRRKFRREATVLQSLNHPHIVRFYSFEEQELLAFLVLEYVAGTSLRALMASRGGKAFSPEEALGYLEPVASALHYGHLQGVYHCDVKPGNILIEEVSGRVLVSDFGVAKLAESATVTTSTPGTPAYMSPEQCRGKGVDHRTDIYSLGITLYEMLTGGERPFTGDKAPMEGATGEKIRWEHLNDQPPSPRVHNTEITPELERVILKALAKVPDGRYGGVMEFLAAYRESLGEGVTVPAIPPSPPHPPERAEESEIEDDRPKRQGFSPMLAVLIGVVLTGAVVLMLGGSGVLSLLASGGQQTPTRVAGMPVQSPMPSATKPPVVPATVTPASTSTWGSTAVPIALEPTSTPMPASPTLMPPTSTPLPPTPTPRTSVAFEERFEGGLTRWTLVGSPVPYIDTSVGNPAPSVYTNGDSYYRSAIVSVQGFALSPGMTITFDGRRESGSRTNAFAVTMYRDWSMTESDTVNWVLEAEWHPKGIMGHVWNGSTHEDSPVMSDIETDMFHHFKVEILEDLRVSLYVDNMSVPLWTSSSSVDVSHGSGPIVVHGNRPAWVDNVLVIYR